MVPQGLFVSYSAEAPISKHQIPNNIQIPISNDPKPICFGIWSFVIGNYLEFGIWILEFFRFSANSFSMINASNRPR